ASALQAPSVLHAKRFFAASSFSAERGSLSLRTLHGDASRLETLFRSWASTSPSAGFNRTANGSSLKAACPSFTSARHRQTRGSPTRTRFSRAASGWQMRWSGKKARNFAGGQPTGSPCTRRTEEIASDSMRTLRASLRPDMSFNRTRHDRPSCRRASGSLSVLCTRRHDDAPHRFPLACVRSGSATSGQRERCAQCREGDTPVARTLQPSSSGGICVRAIVDASLREEICSAQRISGTLIGRLHHSPA
ncbi:MAG: hypothetical protein RL136_1171, partial [Planctomycetota bacterium]